MSTGGGNNEFFEEKCVPMRRGNAPLKPPTGNLPPELKPKFTRPTEEPPEQQLQTPPVPADVFPVAKALDGDAENAPVEADSQNQEVPSKDVETPDLQQGQKKKKKPKKAKKPDEGTAVAVFVEDEPGGEGGNALGQFVEDEVEDDKKGKKKEKPKQGKVPEKERDSNRDKEKELKDKAKQLINARQKQKQPKTESLRQKGKGSSRQKKVQGSQRKTSAAKQVQSQTAVQTPVAPAAAPVAKPAQPKPAAAAPAPAPAAPPKPPAAPVRVDPKPAPLLVKDPNEGFLRGMYAKAKQKIVAMSKNPNYVPSTGEAMSTTDTSMADDTLIANEAALTKLEVVATYGVPTDYPKGILPSKTDKNHPEKLFPGGRPFWMLRTEKPPFARVIVMSELQSRLKIKKETFELPPVLRTDPCTAYCKDWTVLQKQDEHFALNKLLTNTIRSVLYMKMGLHDKNRIGKIKRVGRSRPYSIPYPNQCTTYNRKDFQTKKQLKTQKQLTFRCKVKAKKRTKKKGPNSIAD